MPTSKENLIHIANALELLQNTLKCVICLEMLREPVSTRCGHHFCNLCLTNLLNHKKNGRATCPLCSTVVSRRAIVENDKIRRQVEGVQRLIKAIQADTSIDISQLRQTPGSTNEANASPPGPSTSRNKNRKEIIPLENVPECSEDKEIEDSTPERNPPPKISSAEKVKTWLIQNQNDFECKNTLNEFSNSNKPVPCNEDSDTEMISVSQVANKVQSNVELGKSTSNPIKTGGRPVRRSLKIKEINQLTSTTPPKIFDKLLQETGRESASKQFDNSTVSKISKGSSEKSTVPLSNDKDSRVSREITHAKDASVVTDVNGSCDLNYQNSLLKSQCSIKDVQDLIFEKDVEENALPVWKMPKKELSYAVRTAAEGSPKISSTVSLQTQNTLSSDLDSCEIIPPSEHAEDLPTLKQRRSRVNSAEAQRKEKKKLQLSSFNTPLAKRAMKRTSDQKTSESPIDQKRNTSPRSGVAFLKSGRIGTSRKWNVSFVQYGRVVRERRYMPLDIRCHCVDKPMFLVDLMEPETTIPSVSPKSKETRSVGVQTTSSEPSQELCTCEDTGMDTASQDLFPFSPDKIVQSGGEIVGRRSNNSSIVSDGFMDAATVVLSQPAFSRSLNHDKSGASHQDAEKSVLQSPSDSLLSKNPKSTVESKTAEASEKSIQAAGTNTSKEPESREDSKESTLPVTAEPNAADIENSESDDELVGARVRKSTKRLRQLSSSDDSDYGERKIGRKKRKKSPFSSSDRESLHLMDEDVPSCSLDQTLESPQRLVQGIKAKIAAGMLGRTDEKIQPMTPPRSSPRTPKISRHPSKLTNTDLTSPPRKKPSSDTDLSDCELLEGTPQQESSINTSRRSFRAAKESSSVDVMDTTVTPADSCTPGFVEPTQATCYDLPTSFDSGRKSVVKTSEKNSLDKSIRKTNTSPKGKQEKAEKTPKSQRPLREKNTPEVSISKKTSNNISGASTEEKRLSEKKNVPTPRPLRILTSKSPKNPVQAKRKLCFVCSGLQGNLTAIVQKLAAQFGAEFSTKFDDKTTHLVVKTKEDNTTDKTLKYLCAVAAKKWVVSFQWAVDSMKEGKLLPEERYEALDSTGAQGPRLSRLSSKLLFSNFEFCVIPPFSDITKEQLEELVQMCGAKVISDPKNFSFNADVLPLCLAEWDDDREREYERWIDRYCVPLVQHEWILDCIGRFSLVSFWSLLMSDIADDSLRTMGYPPELIEHPPSDSTEME